MRFLAVGDRRATAGASADEFDARILSTPSLGRGGRAQQIFRSL